MEAISGSDEGALSEGLSKEGEGCAPHSGTDGFSFASPCEEPICGTGSICSIRPAAGMRSNIAVHNITAKPAVDMRRMTVSKRTGFTRGLFW
ncbi:hypothetical protein I4000191A8_14780 [Clostridia bacterium i40-0019-1A8]